MHAIVYVSTAARLLAPEEISALLLQARERNAAAGITGLLLYSNGNFMQYIEGPKAALHEIYRSIKHDPRHYDLLEVFSESISSREFPDWSMAYAPVKHAELLELSNADWRTIAHGNTPGKELLRFFWVQNQLKPTF